jgi:hypothetical protein
MSPSAITFAALNIWTHFYAATRIPILSQAKNSSTAFGLILFEKIRVLSENDGTEPQWLKAIQKPKVIRYYLCLGAFLVNYRKCPKDEHDVWNCHHPRS